MLENRQKQTNKRMGGQKQNEREERKREKKRKRERESEREGKGEADLSWQIGLPHSLIPVFSSDC